MPFATSIVPMPHWSTPLGCTKFFLTIVVLTFISACTAIWGWFPAFNITIFSATLSLLAFGYYMTALSFKPTLYNKWLVLSLETILTLKWFVSLILLAGWTGVSSAIPRLYYDLSPYSTPYSSTTDLSGRSLDRGDFLSHSWEPVMVWKRQDLDVPTTLVRVDGIDALYATQILAGISAGLAGMIFIMYAVTLATFTMNFHCENEGHMSRQSETRTRSGAPQDEEMQMQPRSHHTNTNTNTNSTPALPRDAQIPPTATPPSLTEPLGINSSPREFEPKPQTQEYYLSPAEATEAGIQPPTPVMRALRMEQEQEAKRENRHSENVTGLEREVGSTAGNVIDMPENQNRGTVTRDDGRVEREV